MPISTDAQPGPGSPELSLAETPLSDSVSVYTFGGDDAARAYGANATAVFAGANVLVVDPFISPVHAALLEERIGARAGGRGRIVVVTHHHTDHALGAAWYQRRGATVLAHEACRDRARAEHPGLIASRRSDPLLERYFEAAEPLGEALVTVRREALLRLDDLEVRVIHPGHGHTPGDLVVHVPALSLAVCGDLVSVGYHPNLEDADVAGLRRGLRALLDLRASAYVPGHGPFGGTEVVEAQAEYLAQVEALVEAERGRGGESGARVGEAVRSRFPLYRLGIAVSALMPAFALPGGNALPSESTRLPT